MEEGREREGGRERRGDGGGKGALFDVLVLREYCF